MALRFRWHPLILERLLLLRTERARMYTFESKVLVVLPAWRLCATTRAGVVERKRRGESADEPSRMNSRNAMPDIHVVHTRIGVVVDLRRNMLAYVEPVWERADLRISSWTSPRSRSRHTVEQERPLLRSVSKDMEREYSLMRRGGPDWLLWSMVEIISDELVLVVLAYREIVNALQDRLHAEGDRFDRENVKLILAASADMDNLLKEAKPLKRVLQSLADYKDWPSEELGRYFDDIRIDVSDALESMELVIDVCNSLKGEVQTYKDGHMNDILYVLTIVTTIFVPGQFLTGLYGMNFVVGYCVFRKICRRVFRASLTGALLLQDDDGAPTIPELRWKQ